MPDVSGWSLVLILAVYVACLGWLLVIQRRQSHALRRQAALLSLFDETLLGLICGLAEAGHAEARRFLDGLEQHENVH